MLTPSATSSGLAGAGLWGLFWATLYKLDLILRQLGFKRLQPQNRILSWMERNKGLTLVGTETVNFSVHGISNPLGVTFALGGTVVNIAVLYGWMPLRKKLRSVIQGAEVV